MFIVSQPIRCEMKPQKITAKPQHGLVTTWYETTSWLFLQRTGFSFTTNLQKPNYWIRNRPRIECKLWKFTTVQVFWWRLLSYKKIWIKNHQSQPTSMTLWTAREANTDQPCFWLACYFLLSDVLSCPVWSYLLNSTSLSRNMSLAYHSYLFFAYKWAEIQKEQFQYLKTVKLKICCGRKKPARFVSSGD